MARPKRSDYRGLYSIEVCEGYTGKCWAIVRNESGSEAHETEYKETMQDAFDAGLEWVNQQTEEMYERALALAEAGEE